METETLTRTLAPAPKEEADCRSDRLWTAFSARWLGRCRETGTAHTKEHEAS
jgi:hypothetical protein